MWLLDAKTYELEFFHGPGDDIDRLGGYAILSHTWDEEEVSFQDIKDLHQARRMKGFGKIAFTCRQALKDGFRYAWIDTCCIDKTSSAELSEAINSMFVWYKKSRICYAYLLDVGHDSEVSRMLANLQESRWFSRGWTLQELIAPSNVHFYGRSWRSLGTKRDLVRQIAEITKIDAYVLCDGRALESIAVARRLSWASSRRTTRKEDEAYCLLGIFDINMPLLYGEGHKAFERLQAEILRKHNDFSILLHHPGHHRMAQHRPLFALEPGDFSHCYSVCNCAALTVPPYNLVDSGLHMDLPWIRIKETTYAVFNCRYEDDFDGPIGIAVRFEDQIYNRLDEEETRKGPLIAWFPPRPPMGRYRTIPLKLLPHVKLVSAIILRDQKFQDPLFRLDFVDSHAYEMRFKFFPAAVMRENTAAWPEKHWNRNTNVMQWLYRGESESLDNRQGFVTWKLDGSFSLTGYATCFIRRTTKYPGQAICVVTALPITDRDHREMLLPDRLGAGPWYTCHDPSTNTHQVLCSDAGSAGWQFRACYRYQQIMGYWLNTISFEVVDASSRDGTVAKPIPV